MEAMRAAQVSPPKSEPVADQTAAASEAETDTTFTANTTASSAHPSSQPPKGILKKKAKPKMTAKEKKERAMAIDKIVAALPLEFRGNDPQLRSHAESVISGLLDREDRGVSRTCISILILCYFLNIHQFSSWYGQTYRKLE